MDSKFGHAAPIVSSSGENYRTIKYVFQVWESGTLASKLPVTSFKKRGNRDAAYTDCAATVTIGDQSFRVLLDSGSVLNFITRDVVSAVGAENAIRGGSRLVVLASGDSVQTLGDVSLRVSLSGCSRIVTFSVLRNCVFPVIFGWSALRAFRVTLSFATSETIVVPQKNLAERLSEQERAELMKLLQSFRSVFAKTSESLGQVRGFEHVISVESQAKPFRSAPYRIPYALRDEVKRQISDMLAQGVIRKSNSPWSSPFFLIPKKNGAFRFVVDFRRLNSVTVRDAHPLPHPDDIQLELQGTAYFSTLDCDRGYWQIPLAEESRQYTAFQADGDLYEFCVLPFGLSNGVATFQRMITDVLSGLKTVPYIDDILVASATFDQHLVDLSAVLERLYSAGIKLQPSKCRFGEAETRFLGHLISARGFRPDPLKVEAIKEYKCPTTRKEADKFCGLINYLSRYVPNLANTMEPIFRNKGTRGKFIWTEECTDAFEKAKTLISKQTLLSHPDWNQPFKLNVDASNVAVGAVLSQNNGPIAYYSRTLSNSERNYSATDREFVALIAAVKHFRTFLYGHSFTVFTDHQPLLAMVRSKPLNGRHARYHLLLQEYDFDLKFIPGRQNTVADALSRSKLNPDADTFLCAVSESDVDELIRRFHFAGHFGTNKVRNALLRAGHWFPRMRARIRAFADQCQTCRAKSYGANPPRGELPKDCTPRTVVAVDIVGPLPTAKQHRFILTIIDHSTRFLAAVPLTEITADSIAKGFETEWLLRYGAPSKVIHDNGPQFKSAKFVQLCARYGIRQCRTTEYHPEGNSVIERAHRTLKDRLRCALVDFHGTWQDHLARAVSDINRSTDATEKFLGFTPRTEGDNSELRVSRTECKLPCPKFVYPRDNRPPHSLAPRFCRQVRVDQRLSPQLVRTEDGKIHNLRNCRTVW